MSSVFSCFSVPGCVARGTERAGAPGATENGLVFHQRRYRFSKSAPREKARTCQGEIKPSTLRGRAHRHLTPPSNLLQPSGGGAAKDVERIDEALGRSTGWIEIPCSSLLRGPHARQQAWLCSCHPNACESDVHDSWRWTSIRYLQAVGDSPREHSNGSPPCGPTYARNLALHSSARCTLSPTSLPSILPCP